MLARGTNFSFLAGKYKYRHGYWSFFTSLRTITAYLAMEKKKLDILHKCFGFFVTIMPLLGSELPFCSPRAMRNLGEFLYRLFFVIKRLKCTRNILHNM